MSKITGVILTYSVAEAGWHGNGFPLRHVLEWLDQKGFPPLVSVDGAITGWHPGCRIAIGGYNHFDDTGFADFIQNLPWAYPEDAILIIVPEEDGARVIRPAVIDG